MVTEKQKYVSSVFKNLGFSFLVPIGSMTFQYLLLEKRFSINKVIICSVISLLSWFLFYVGYNTVKESKNDQ